MCGVCSVWRMAWHHVRARLPWPWHHAARRCCCAAHALRTRARACTRTPASFSPHPGHVPHAHANALPQAATEPPQPQYRKHQRSGTCSGCTTTSTKKSRPRSHTRTRLTPRLTDAFCERRASGGRCAPSPWQPGGSAEETGTRSALKQALPVHPHLSLYTYTSPCQAGS